MLVKSPLLYLLLCCFPLLSYAESLCPPLKGDTAVVMHTETGKVLYAKSAHKRIFPASMTKIATALFILRKYPDILERHVFVKYEAIASITPQAKRQSGYRSPPYWLETDGVTVQLQHKEEVLGLDLFYALLVCSANDAANALAMGCCHSIPIFMKQVNEFLLEIGCEHTHFNNPHGLHHPEHYTTAYDLSLIMREALKEPLFRKVIQTTSYKMAPTNLSQERALHPTNKLILPTSTYYYPPCLGGKTGTTKSAGKNLIFAAEKNQRSVITIATGYTGPVSDLYQDVISLCEGVFNEPLLRRYFIRPTEKYLLPMGKLGRVEVSLSQGIYSDFYESEGETVVMVRFSPKADSLPIYAGDLLGEWEYYDDKGEKVLSEPFYAEGTIHLRFKQKIRLFLRMLFTSRKFYMLLFTIWMLAFLRRKKRPQRMPSRRIFG